MNLQLYKKEGRWRGSDTERNRGGNFGREDKK